MPILLLLKSVAGFPSDRRHFPGQSLPSRKMPVCSTIFILLVTTLGAGCAPTSRPELPFQPPRQVTCGDARLMGFSRGTDGFPAAHSRHGGNGFSVVPPEQGDWCFAFDHTAEVSASLGFLRGKIVFSRNNYSGELLTAEPTYQRRYHTFLAYAMLWGRRASAVPPIWDITSLQNEPTDVQCGEGCRVVSQQKRLANRFSAQCILKETTVIMREFAKTEYSYECIHPQNPRFLVEVGVSERYISGSPYYAPLLMDKLRPEYGSFLDSLMFAPLKVD